MVPQLSDPRRSRVVLVGGSTYRKLPHLPSVEGNLAALARVLSDPDRWGVSNGHCRVIRDPATPGLVHEAIREASAATEVDGLLLVYFAGHGITDPRTGELHLATSDADPDAVYATALPYDWLRRGVLDSPAGRRVVILDCCYAGRAIGGMDSGSVGAEVEIDRSCVLVAAPANRAALAPPDEQFTAFTGVLLDLLTGGVPGGGDPLDLTTIYEEIVRVQRARGRPLPELRARNGGERIPLVRNGAVSGTRSGRYTGQVLVASPTSDDPDLAGATVAILAHGPADGALGVRLDRPTNRSPAEVIGERRAGALRAPVVFAGGPVHDIVLLLVWLPRGAPRPAGFTPVCGELGTLPLGTEPVPATEAAYLFVGYLGWRPGQLEAEVVRGDLAPSGVDLAGWLESQVHLR